MNEQKGEMKAVALQQAVDYPAIIATLSVVDEPSKAVANNYLVGIKALAKRISDTFDPLVTNAHGAWKAALKQRDIFLKPLEEAERVLKDKLRIYVLDQESKRLAAEAEAQRVAEAAQRRADELLEKAVQVEQSGDVAEAEKLVQEATAAEAQAVEEKPIIPPKTTLEGAHVRRELRWRVVDAAKVPREYLCVDTRAVEATFKQLREKLAIPGIETYWHEDISVRPGK